MTELDTVTVRRAQAGDRAAQEAFLRRYIGPMHALVRRCGAQADADDTVHDMLSHLVSVLPRYQAGGSATLTTWVFTVSQRFLIDAGRKRHLQLAPIEAAHEVADHRPTADSLIERKELGRRIENALATLPVDQRRVFVLAQVHQRPLQEIADTEGVPIGTIKSRLHRARAALVEVLRPVVSGEGGAHAVAR